MITSGNAKDAEKLAILGHELFLQTYDGMMNSEDLRAYADEHFTQNKMLAELAQPNNTFFLAQDNDGRLSGYCKLTQGSAPDCISTPRPAELARIYISRTAQGQGLGTALFESARTKAKDEGCTGLWLSVWDEHHRGIAFHRRMGFQTVGEHPFQVGRETQRDFIMFQDLS